MSRLEPDAGTVVDSRGDWSLVLNRNQNLLGKLMLVLRRDCEDVLSLTLAEWIGLHSEIRRASIALDSLFSPDLFNYAFLMNADSQVHLHVLPRYSQPRAWGSLTFDDPHFGEAAGPEVSVLDTATLTELANVIRAALPDHH